MPQAAKVHRSHNKPKRDNRRTAAQRGYSSRWQRARLVYLSTNPYCVICKHMGKVKLAKVVDHIEPHRGNEELFWDQSNWQPLCERHHNQKTASGR